MQKYIDQLEQKNGLVPKEAFAGLTAQPKEATPLLLALVEKVTKHPTDFEQERLYNGHIYASFLLAQFREKAFLPVFRDFLSLPSDKIDQLFNDLITESAGQIAASIMDKQDLDTIKQFIENEHIDIYARGA